MSRHVTDHLSAYLDGALGVRDLEHVQAHLEVCPSCLREYEEFRALRGMLRRLPEPPVPRGFAERIHWRLQREAVRPGRPSLLGLLPSLRFAPARLALVCATLLLVLGLPLAWMWRGGAHETPLDADAYLRYYLVLSADRPLADPAATTLETSNVPAPESQTR